MDPKALKLCSRFALTPNQLGFCGASSAQQKLTNCILTGDCKDIETELKQFIILNPYLQTISQIYNLDPFSYEVIEAYWFGNDLLKKCQPKHYDLLLDNFEIQGVPNFLIKELKQKKPKEFIPIHLFNILHVGVGRASGSVPFNLNSINNCMIRWGEILEINKKTNKVKIALNSLFCKEGTHFAENKIEERFNSYHLSTKTCNLSFNSQFTPNLKIGDTVSIHWNFIPKKLTQKEIKNLKFWTKKLINSIKI